MTLTTLNERPQHVDYDFRLTVRYVPCYVRQLDNFTRIVLSKCDFKDMYLFDVYWCEKQYIKAIATGGTLASELMQNELSKEQLYALIDDVSAAKWGADPIEFTIKSKEECCAS